jgi:hypothetical protein
MKQLVLLVVCSSIGCGPQQESPSFDPNQAANEVTRRMLKQPDVAAKASVIASKEAAFEQFLKKHGVSDEIAEAAVKEWVLTHGGNFDWVLEEVQQICLRNQRTQIPEAYKPSR